VENLRSGGVGSQAALDKAQTRQEVSRAQRDLARVALDNREIRAPIDGTVIRRIRDVGEFLTIGVNAEGRSRARRSSRSPISPRSRSRSRSARARSARSSSARSRS
jgi:multidrug efflux pump subunit AcrA (membrane-fusion protein)